MRNIMHRKAQTAVELAVFGAILIFVMGLIIKSTHSRGLQQHTFLRSTRMAMAMSHMTTESKTIAGRNNATVFVVEDRLVAASEKYGAIDRMPMMNQGSAVHSANLFMPIDFVAPLPGFPKYHEDLPVLDLFINGRHFVFTAGVFKSVQLARSCAMASPCPPECVGATGSLDCSVTSPYYYPGSNDLDGDPLTPDVPMEWEPDCLDGKTITTVTASCADTTTPPGDFDPPWDCPSPACLDCSDVSTQTYSTQTVAQVRIGCARLYTIIDNHPLIPQWCDDGFGATARACPAACSAGITKGCNLSANERFDLDRNDLDGLPGDLVVPVNERENFSWEWFLVAGAVPYQGTSFIGSSSLDPTVGTQVISTASLVVGEGMVLPGGEVEAQNATVDVDLDLKLEYVMGNNEGMAIPANFVGNFGVITRLGVMDSQDGDIDFTFNDSDQLIGKLAFGFTKDVNLYTFVQSGGSAGGTYFQIDEGNLYGGGRQYIRTASKKDSIDLIERTLQLSNDTGAFCGLVAGGGPPPMANGIPNPVEVCGWTPGACFFSGNMDKICMDVANKVIFIRSRIRDLHGRKWVTDESQDPYLNFLVN